MLQGVVVPQHSLAGLDRPYRAPLGRHAAATANQTTWNAHSWSLLRLLLLYSYQLYCIPARPARQVVETFIRCASRPIIVCAPMYRPFFDEDGSPAHFAHTAPIMTVPAVVRQAACMGLWGGASPGRQLPAGRSEWTAESTRLPASIALGRRVPHKVSTPLPTLWISRPLVLAAVHRAYLVSPAIPRERSA